MWIILNAHCYWIAAIFRYCEKCKNIILLVNCNAECKQLKTKHFEVYDSDEPKQWYEIYEMENVAFRYDEHKFENNIKCDQMQQKWLNGWNAAGTKPKSKSNGKKST